MYHKYIIYYT